jgi:hypothetical protein
MSISPTSPVQANRTHGLLLTTLMRYAIKRKFRGDNPCAGVKRYPESERTVHTYRLIASLDNFETSKARCRFAG